VFRDGTLSLSEGKLCKRDSKISLLRGLNSLRSKIAASSSERVERVRGRKKVGESSTKVGTLVRWLK
jgi:hypothetical protein